MVLSLMCCLLLGAGLLVGGRSPKPRVAAPIEVRPRIGVGWRWWSCGACVVGAVVLGSPLLVAALPLLMLFGRRELRRRRTRSALAERADLALGFVVDAASGLRAGRSLSGAVLDGSAVRNGGVSVNVLRSEVVARVEAGRSFAVAVDEVLGGGSVDERLIATTVRALDATGASAGVALERVAEALGERRSSREDARTQAQHALSSAGVLAALPFVFGVAAGLAEPDVGRLYVSSWVGAGCVGVSLVLIFGSWEWLQRLLEPVR